MSKPLTDWEVGQELCKMQDAICENLAEFKDSHPEQYEVCLKAAKIIGKVFNKNHFESHGFGLYDGEKARANVSKD